MNQFVLPFKKLYTFVENFRFTNKIKGIFAVVFLLLITSIVLSMFYLSNIKVFSEETTTAYLKSMNLSHQLEVLVTNEESLLSKHFLSDANIPTYLFSLRQNHHELKNVIDEIERNAFDDNLKENINLLKKHSVEVDQMLDELWNSAGTDRSNYETILSHYTFIKNTAIEISNYSSNRYDSVRYTAIKIINNSLIINAVLSAFFILIFILCFLLIMRISATMELRAARDPLTGLFNRRVLDEKIKQLVAAAENGGYRFSLVMLDIDHFKKINDTYGHKTGDKVLKELAVLLNTFASPGNMVARYGGEEIALVLANTGITKAHLASEHLRKLVEKHIFSTDDGTPINVTVSLGVAEFNRNADLVKEADSALYRSKSNGRNQVNVASNTQGLLVIQV